MLKCIRNTFVSVHVFSFIRRIRKFTSESGRMENQPADIKTRCDRLSERTDFNINDPYHHHPYDRNIFCISRGHTRTRTMD